MEWLAIVVSTLYQLNKIGDRAGRCINIEVDGDFSLCRGNEDFLMRWNPSDKVPIDRVIKWPFDHVGFALFEKGDSPFQWHVRFIIARERKLVARLVQERQIFNNILESQVVVRQRARKQPRHGQVAKGNAARVQVE